MSVTTGQNAPASPPPGIVITDAPPPANQPPAPPPANEGEGEGEDNYVDTASTIAERARAADALIARLREGQNQPPANQPPANQPPANQPPTPPANQPPEPPPAGDDVAELRRRLAAAEHDASTWRGRHGAETKRLSDAVADLTAKLEAAVGQKAKDTFAQALEGIQGVTQEESEHYGQEMLTVFTRHAMAQIKPLLDSMAAALRAEFAGLVKPVEDRVQAAQETADERAKREFLEGLTARVPSWGTLDRDPGFNKWLDEPDPLYDVPRRNGLDSAVHRRDHGRAAAFFTAYLDQRGGGAPQVPGGQQPPASATPAANGQGADDQDGRMTLADLAAPGGTRQPGQADGHNPDANGLKRWTRQDIATFYATAYSDPKWKGREAERDRIEREIAKAQREGRVTA